MKKGNNKNIEERIIAEIRKELDNVNHISLEFDRFRRKYPEPDEFLLRALGSLIADFYNAVEKLFCIISEECDGGLPQGEMWHKRLLTDMRIPIGERTPVISDDLYARLLPFLGFRHVFRQAYGFELDKKKVMALAENLRPINLEPEKT